MCGLFGSLASPGQFLAPSDLALLKNNALLAERRGSDASGLLIIDSNERLVAYKARERISLLSNDPQVREATASGRLRAVFGHSRLETHGSSSAKENNQPVILDDWFVLHNGIITNHADIRRTFSGNELPGDSDTFAIAALLQSWDKTDDQQLLGLLEVCEGELTIIAGSIRGDLLLYTNVGNLYSGTTSNGTIHFASEPRQLSSPAITDVRQIQLGLTTLQRARSSSDSKPIQTFAINNPRRSEIYGEGLHLTQAEIPSRFVRKVEALNQLVKEYARDQRRCSRCLLPTTFPNLEFDASQQCKFCQMFKRPTYPGIDALADELRAQSPDQKSVLVCLSGGRDSCFALHLVKELGFKPTAYTYDWGMVTTAARNNMARICGKLNVEHVLVSPDLALNRKRVKRALEGWHRDPDPALIPILMAGDKPYFRFASIVARERGGLPAVMADHYLETTGFKSMLAGAAPKFDSQGGVSYRLTTPSLCRMGLRYLGGGVKNPALLGSVLTEGLTGFRDYYLRKHSFVRPFTFVEWDEGLLSNTLTSLYGWSKGDDADLPAWRMGDATAPFYNLVYLLTIGMTEHDALRSNQIRFGLLTREEAAEKLASDNQISALGLATYYATAGFTADNAYELLNSLAKPYLK